jgi:BMFP domain-containing protein YqiC
VRRGAATVSVDPAMSRLPRLAMAAAVLSGMAAAPGAAQQPSLPDGVVARVGHERISERQFRHWLGIGIRGESSPVDPPRFERCIAAERQKASEQRRPSSERELRSRCRDRYEALRDSTMLFLLHRVWTRQEAAGRGLAVAPEQVRRAFERKKREAFPTERAFREFLRSSGLSKADLLKRIEFDMLQRRLIRAATANVPEVTREEVERYYARHRRRFSELSPASARRATRVQLTATRQQRAIARFLDQFRSRYRTMTTCAKGYVIDACSNAP